MAFPKWLTPAGDLGTIPELDYYQYSLDAFDVNSGTLEYQRISGVLPEGIQITPTGVLQGIPITTPTVGEDLNETYTFSIRAKNLSTGNVGDRTFRLTITNVAPPIITPKTVVNNNLLELVGNITANIGDYLTQPLSGANALVNTGVISSTELTVVYVPGSPLYTLGEGNLRIVSGNLSLYSDVNVDSFPISSTVVSTINTRDLGLYFSGQVIDLQLEAIEFANSSTLTWSLNSGEIPAGLALSSDGLLSGYILPIPVAGPGSNPGWSRNPWDLLGWDFALGFTSKNFSFTIEASDGVNSDVCTYTMLVTPNRFVTADSTLISADTISVNGKKLSVDSNLRRSIHFPIILSKQADISVEREGGKFSFQIQALDLDGDVLQYIVPAQSSGAFDEQSLIGESVPYIADTLIDDVLYSGVFPKINTVVVFDLQLFPGNSITASEGSYITQSSSGANARVHSSVTNKAAVPITVVTGRFTAEAGNLALNGVELVKTISSGDTIGVVPLLVSTTSTTSTVSIDNTSPGLVAGDQIQVLKLNSSVSSVYWHTAAVTSNTSVRLSGNTIISASSGQYITQEISGANATISNVSSSTGTLELGGNAIVGTLIISGTAISANIGDFITQPSTGANATITSNVFFETTIPVVFTSGTFLSGSVNGTVRVNGANVAAFINGTSTRRLAETFAADVGDFITQPSTGANATVLETQYNGTSALVNYTSGKFELGQGNIQLNGADIKMYPVAANMHADVAVVYNSSNVFIFNTLVDTAYTRINGVQTYAIPTEVLSVGVITGATSTQGDVGFDEGKFDQSQLVLPEGLSLDITSGWLTGTLPTQTINEIVYNFNIAVYKKDFPFYRTEQQFTLTVLGDLNNRIDWLTPSNLGTIQNGAISDLSVKAISSRGRTLYYEYTAGGRIRLPQGLILLSSGVISGRVSFAVFNLDQNSTNIDSGTTTFDDTCTFSVTAKDFNRTIAATREFTIRVIERNVKPYENLYLKAFLSRSQRAVLQEILENRKIFPLDMVYRNEDPFYGLARDIKTLFLPGLSPSLLEQYAAAVSTNHFTKRINFGNIKTAVAVDGSYDVIEVATGIQVGTYQDDIGFIPSDFSLGYAASANLPEGTEIGDEHVKYEVIYAEITDANTNAFGRGPANTIDLTGTINPYYDLLGNEYTVAYPNSFSNMSNVMLNNIPYLDKGVLPDWMTSKQPSGRILGFTRAVVLAYVQPGAGDTIAYRFQQADINLNELDFSVDRYQLDNNYTTNFDVVADAYIVNKETTFDRYPGLNTIFTPVGVIDYAVDLSFEEINRRSIGSINSLGGLDGITSFVDGERLVFFQQEFAIGTAVGDTYNLGWANVISSWGAEPWDFDNGTIDNLNDDLAWDAAGYVPGYFEYILNPARDNQRIGIWEINIANNLVSLSFVSSMEFNNTLYVRNGFTYGATNIYYDPVIKSNKIVPNYSIISQQVRIIATTFDGNGTRFLDYRDSYSVPEQGDKYIKFTQADALNTLTKLSVAPAVIGSFDSDIVTFDSEALTFDQE